MEEAQQALKAAKAAVAAAAAAAKTKEQPSEAGPNSDSRPMKGRSRLCKRPSIKGRSIKPLIYHASLIYVRRTGCVPAVSDVEEDEKGDTICECILGRSLLYRGDHQTACARCQTKTSRKVSSGHLHLQMKEMAWQLLLGLSPSVRRCRCPCSSATQRTIAHPQRSMLPAQAPPGHLQRLQMAPQLMMMWCAMPAAAETRARASCCVMAAMLAGTWNALR